jgi:hypothetical protein
MVGEVMKRLEIILVAILASAPGPARSADANSVALSSEPLATPVTPSPPSAPAETPPTPPAQPPAPPPQAQAADAQRASSGQWVYTEQYGWVWMPYGDAYSYVPPDGEGEPYEYVYYPSYGWTWVVAPWIWGFGPWPYFGVYGPAYFGWYAHGWWRSPWRWHFRPAPFHGGFTARGFRSAPFRNGFVTRGAPGGRGFVGHGHFAGGGRGGGHR